MIPKLPKPEFGGDFGGIPFLSHPQRGHYKLPHFWATNRSTDRCLTEVNDITWGSGLVRVSSAIDGFNLGVKFEVRNLCVIWWYFKYLSYYKKNSFASQTKQHIWWSFLDSFHVPKGIGRKLVSVFQLLDGSPSQTDVQENGKKSRWRSELS